MKLINVCTNCQVVTNKDRSVIFSYGTPVFAMPIGDYSGGLRLWSGWSATTQRHINKALDLYGLPHINKAEWEKMPVVDCNF